MYPSQKPYFTVLLFLLAFFASLAFAGNPNYSAPLHAEGATTVNVNEAEWLYDDGAVFIDTRNPRFFARGHIPGSHHLDMKGGFTRETLAAVARKDQPIVIYSSGESCSRAHKGTVLAVAWGYEKVYYFRGGFVDWRDVDLPLVSSKQ